MTKFFLLPLLLILSLFITGCVSDVANRYYLNEKLPSKDPSKVEILRTKPTREFIVLADFQSRGESASSLQKKAAEIGADAVLVSNLGGYISASESWAGNDRYAGSGNRVVGTAIIYK